MPAVLGVSHLPTQVGAPFLFPPLGQGLGLSPFVGRKGVCFRTLPPPPPPHNGSRTLVLLAPISTGGKGEPTDVSRCLW